MRLLPRISLSTHGLALLVTGLVLVSAAAVGDLGGTGTIAVFAAGVSLAGLGLGALEQLPLATLRALDLSLVGVLAAGAVGCAVAQAVGASVILLVTAGAVLVLESTTRWTRAARR